ncbi:MAG: hypothetical protein CMH57_05280 [Myxococcales bacterium]|nr:hypothetical protein [Myxococcales bacterium]
MLSSNDTTRALGLSVTLALLAFTACSGDEGGSESTSENNGGCVEGAMGCPCHPDGTCDSLGGVAMECVADVCAAPGATNNNTGGTTTTGTSTGGTTPSVEIELRVATTEARSCEVVLRDPAAAIQRVDFGDAVMGQHRRHGERVAVAFVARADSAIADGAVTLDAQGDTGGVQLIVNRCADRRGQEIAMDAPVSVHTP